MIVKSEIRKPKSEAPNPQKPGGNQRGLAHSGFERLPDFGIRHSAFGLAR